MRNPHPTGSNRSDPAPKEFISGIPFLLTLEKLKSHDMRSPRRPNHLLPTHRANEAVMYARSCLSSLDLCLAGLDQLSPLDWEYQLNMTVTLEPVEALVKRLCLSDTYKITAIYCNTVKNDTINNSYQHICYFNFSN